MRKRYQIIHYVHVFQLSLHFLQTNEIMHLLSRTWSLLENAFTNCNHIHGMNDMCLRKESDGQHIHQHQQNETSPLISTH